MARWIVRGTGFLAAMLLGACATSGEGGRGASGDGAAVSLASMGVAAPRGAGRAISFTNKRSAYFYTQSHRNDHPEHAWFAGFNVAQKRIFSEYRLIHAGAALDPDAARTVVYPDRMQRDWPTGVRETLRLVDDQDVVEITVEGVGADVDLILSGDGVRRLETRGDLAVYATIDAPNKVTAVARAGPRFYVLVAAAQADLAAEMKTVVAKAETWRAARAARLTALVNGRRFVDTDDDHVTAALRWLAVTTDQLVTRQRGDGIYAGLPWFNEYWGRDSFIALPGALLVTGEFEAARAVVTSFAEFQDLDPQSTFYGRVPNIVRPADLDYHTTDGTPRFVIAIRDYVAYTGDVGLIDELYPNVKASILGAIANWTDAEGFLVHADNETWMDARRAEDLVPYSPRGASANDIQALWRDQLAAGAAFARHVGDVEAAQDWAARAAALTDRFNARFVDVDARRVADRLDHDGAPDFSLRPNALFALDLVADETVRAQAVRTAWEALVFPWGVASLDPDHPDFHPYHLAWDRYHKDSAYHNGTIWIWLNGIAMQRMIETGQIAPAWALFAAGVDQTLGAGVIGGLAENMDAYPRPGADWPRLTGAYLQAWSNSEHLRIWNQWFLGVRPDLTRGAITLAPRLPTALGGVDFAARIGEGVIHGRYETRTGGAQYAWRFKGLSTDVVLDVPRFTMETIAVEAGDTVRATVRDGAALVIDVTAPDGAVRRRFERAQDPARIAAQNALDAALDGVAFAAPRDPESHPVMRRRHDGGRGL